MHRVLIVDEEDNLRHSLQLLLRQQGLEAVGASSIAAAFTEIERQAFELVITVIQTFDGIRFDLVDEVQRRKLDTTVIALVGAGFKALGIEAMKRGAYDCLSRPFDNEEVMLLLRRVQERERLLHDNMSLRRQLHLDEHDPAVGVSDMIAKSTRMAQVSRTIRKIAEFKSTVLIGGESGTGKELAARAIHRFSPRSSGPFIAVNCGAIPGPLLESELFGHRKGAFTDASRDRKGLFEEANGGTLFLDEIGELPLGLQVKLLRVLQEEEIRRLGDTQDIKVDVRVVAATARDLSAEVKRGAFREDLYYRLNVLSVQLPPLKDRREDIPLLVDHFIQRMNARMGLSIRGASHDAMRLLIEWDWPGNVRELENTIERAMVLSEGELIDVESLPEQLRKPGSTLFSLPVSDDDLSIKRASRRAEEDLIRRALVRTSGNRTRAAELLEISHRALLYKIKEYGIAVPKPSSETRPPSTKSN